jgi:hypothetical protein
MIMAKKAAKKSKSKAKGASEIEDGKLKDPAVVRAQDSSGPWLGTQHQLVGPGAASPEEIAQAQEKVDAARKASDQAAAEFLQTFNEDPPAKFLTDGAFEPGEDDKDYFGKHYQILDGVYFQGGTHARFEGGAFKGAYSGGAIHRVAHLNIPAASRSVSVG